MGKKVDEQKSHDKSVQKLTDELKKDKGEVKANPKDVENPPPRSEPSHLTF